MRLRLSLRPYRPPRRARPLSRAACGAPTAL